MNRPFRNRVSPAALCAAASVLAACSGGGGDGAPIDPPLSTFFVLTTEPPSDGTVFLNDTIAIDFTRPIAADSLSRDVIRFQAFDENGNPLTEQPSGTFSVVDAPTGAQRRLLFEPKLPEAEDYGDGGLRPGRTYLIAVVGGDRQNDAALRDDRGRAVEVPYSFRVRTAMGTTPRQLFRDRRPGGPRVVSVTASTGDLQALPLNEQGQYPLEIRVAFDQPLEPTARNVPRVDARRVAAGDRGRLWLEYDDVERGPSVWLPADVELERNDAAGAVVVLRPWGVLPNDAALRLVVQSTLQDLSGQDNSAVAAWTPVAARVRTVASPQSRFDAVVEAFVDRERIDDDVAFVEPPAEVRRGELRAGLQFAGGTTTRDWRPIAREVVLNTDFAQVTPENGPSYNVSGGVFEFRNVTIPAGVRVQGLGRNPLVILCSGNMTIAGELSVRGGDGQRVNTLRSANFPAAGGVGVCTGGNGGAGSLSGNTRDRRGQNGFGAFQVPGDGGVGGELACGPCRRGSGGGGGSFATQGDPWYKRLAGPGTVFPQQLGAGGRGCVGAAGAATRTMAGGAAGPGAFTDLRADNDFFGTAIDPRRQLRITGEIAVPRGGTGGGGGGDLSDTGNCAEVDPNFINDRKGGGGGGGGGCLVIQAIGRITVEATGRIVADGGHGGGGEQAGSCNEGGGGGGGSGGMILLMAGERIVLHTRGSNAAWTYQENDYDCVLSADGGVTLTGTFGGPNVTGKYPASGQLPMTGVEYDQNPLGGFGGLGVIQLMAPPGDNADGTNTILDDGIDVFRSGQQLSGAQKQRMLAWRGLPQPDGRRVDDAGNVVDIGANEGDIRPAPQLLPTPISARSRARSRWLPLGAAVRRPLAAPDGGARYLLANGGNGAVPGPQFSFAGTTTNAAVGGPGWVAFDVVGGRALAAAPAVLSTPAGIARAEVGIVHRGQAAHRIELSEAALGELSDRYAHYRVEIADVAGNALGSFRILAHEAQSLVVAATAPWPQGAGRLQVRAHFFDVDVDGSEGLGAVTGTGNAATPAANVRIGFAFHRNSPAAVQSGEDPDRYPSRVGEFVHDLADPAVAEAVRRFGASWVQWDVLFDIAWSRSPNDPQYRLSPGSLRPSLRNLVLPFRF
ncbi:MAG: hypothetical protein IPK26_13855 [Planctomycetes bacterium]|nr:hypothetical protein [Planctomycetota bacterium]